MRFCEATRKTFETDIKLMLTLDGKGNANIKTGIGFFDHMLKTLAKHSGFDIELYCDGDLEVDTHHTIEDCGILLGEAFKNCLKDKSGINRYSSSVIPMDDALVMAAVDLSGRFYYESNVVFTAERVGEFETECVDEFFRSFASNAGINLHFVYFRGKNNHHLIEDMFKTLAQALKIAVSYNDSIEGTLSTKGSI